MSNPFAYQNLNDTEQSQQAAAIGQYPQLPDHMGYTIPPTPQFIQMHQFPNPDNQMAMPISMQMPVQQQSMQVPMQMQMPMHMQMSPMAMGMPMGMPISNHQGMMVVPMNAEAGINVARIREIDFKLDNGYGCYRCWLWFVFIVSIVGTLADLVLLTNKQFRPIILITFFELIAGGLTCYSFFQGILAMRMKSFEKNELFKKLLIVSTVAYVLASVLADLEIDKIEKTRNSGYDNQPSQSANGGTMAVGIVVGVVIRAIVYYTADKISALLRDRKQLIAG